MSQGYYGDNPSEYRKRDGKKKRKGSWKDKRHKQNRDKDKDSEGERYDQYKSWERNKDLYDPD